MGDSVKSHAEVKADNIHCSSPTYPALQPSSTAHLSAQCPQQHFMSLMGTQTGASTAQTTVHVFFLGLPTHHTFTVWIQE